MIIKEQAVAKFRYLLNAVFAASLFLLSIISTAVASDTTRFLCPYSDGSEYTISYVNGEAVWCTSVPNYDADWWPEDGGNCYLVAPTEIAGYWDANGWEIFIPNNWPYINKEIWSELVTEFGWFNGVRTAYLSMKYTMQLFGSWYDQEYSHYGKYIVRAMGLLDPDANSSWNYDDDVFVSKDTIMRNIGYRHPPIFSWRTLRRHFCFHNDSETPEGFCRSSGWQAHSSATIGYRIKINPWYQWDEFYVFSRSGWRSGGDSYIAIHWSWGDDYLLTKMAPKVVSGTDREAVTSHEDKFDYDRDGHFDSFGGIDYPGVTKGEDCNDTEISINTDALEVLCNGTDDDCDWQTDEETDAPNSDKDCLYDTKDNCPFLDYDDPSNHDNDYDCVPDQYDLCPENDPNPLPLDQTEHPDWRFQPIGEWQEALFIYIVDTDQDCIPDINDINATEFNPKSPVSCTGYWGNDNDGNGIADCKQTDVDQDGVLDYEDYCPSIFMTKTVDQDGDCIPDHNLNGFPVPDDRCPKLFLPNDNNDWVSLDSDKDCIIDESGRYKIKLINLDFSNGDTTFNGPFVRKWGSVPQDNCAPLDLLSDPSFCPWKDPNPNPNNPDHYKYHEELCCSAAQPANCNNSRQENLDILTETQNQFAAMGDICDKRPALSFVNDLDMSYQYSNFQLSPRSTLCNEDRIFVMESIAWRLNFETMSTPYYAGRNIYGRIFTLIMPQPQRLGSDQRKVTMEMCFCDESQGGNGCQNCNEIKSSSFNDKKKIQYSITNYLDTLPVINSVDGELISFDNNRPDGRPAFLGGKNTKNGYSYTWDPITGIIPPLDPGTDWENYKARIRFVHYEPDKITYTDTNLHGLAVGTGVHSLVNQSRFHSGPCIPINPGSRWRLPLQRDDHRAQEYLPGWWKLEGNPGDNPNSEWRQFILDVGEQIGFSLPSDATLSQEKRNAGLAAAAGPIAITSIELGNVGINAPQGIDTEIALIQSYYQGATSARDGNPGIIYIGLTTNSQTKWTDLSLNRQLYAPSPRSRVKLLYLPETKQLLLIGDYMDKDNNNVTDVHLFNLLSLSWEYIADLPDQRTDYEAVIRSSTNEIWYFGGYENSQQIVKDVLVLNLKSKVFTRFDTDFGDPSRRINHSVIYDSQSDRFFIFGGSSVNGSETDGIYGLVPPPGEIDGLQYPQSLPAWLPVVGGGSSATGNEKIPLMYDPYSHRFMILIADDEENGYFEAAYESCMTGFVIVIDKPERP